MEYNITQEKNLFATHINMQSINLILNKRRMLFYKTYILIQFYKIPKQVK